MLASWLLFTCFLDRNKNDTQTAFISENPTRPHVTELVEVY